MHARMAYGVHVQRSHAFMAQQGTYLQGHQTSAHGMCGCVCSCAGVRTHSIILMFPDAHACYRVCMHSCIIFSDHQQVARDFEELPEGAVSSLRDSLMALLLKFAKCVSVS